MIPLLYKNVFTEVASTLGAAGERLEELKKHYAKLIKEINGHLYYHLPSYYSALSALPGGKKNIDQWHQMIGGKIEDNEFNYQTFTPNRWETLKTIVNLLKQLIFSAYFLKQFEYRAESFKAKISQQINNSNTPEKTISLIQHLANNAFGFGFTAINDLLLMIYLGIFNKRADKLNIPESERGEFLKVEGNDVDSTGPLIELIKIKNSLPKNIEGSFDSMNEFFEWIDDAEVVQMLKTYLSKYGHRSFEELKFESTPLSEDPNQLIQLIQTAPDEFKVSKAKRKKS